MKRLLKLLSSILAVSIIFIALGFKAHAVEATDPGNVTIEVASTSSVTVTGTTPEGSSVEYSSTYTSKCQLIAEKSMTFTLKGYSGLVISGVYLSTRSNSGSGAGYYSLKSGDTTMCSLGIDTPVKYNDSKWNGSWSTEYSYNAMKFDAFVVGEDEDLVITIGATTNSIYCNKISISYTDKSLVQYNTETQNTKASILYDYGIHMPTYDLVTDTSELKAGDEIIIVAKDYNVGLSNLQTDNAIKNIDVSLNDNHCVPKYGIQIITLEASSYDNYYYLKTDNGYIYEAGGKSSNYLKIQSKKTDNGIWIISISEGITNISSYLTYDTNNLHKQIKYNSNKDQLIFSAYKEGNTQKAISIYKNSSKKTVGFSYENLRLRFGAVIDKELFDKVQEEAGTFTIKVGVLLSKDGTHFTKYEVTEYAVVNIDESGNVTSSLDGKYVQWAVVVDTPVEHYKDVVYAKAYIEVDDAGTLYEMQSSSYSVNTLMNYYKENASKLGINSEILKDWEAK